MRKQILESLPPAGDEARRRLPPLLRRSWFRLNQTFRRRIAQFDLTPDQFTILRWLVEHPKGVTQKELAGLMASDANTVTAMLNRMEESEIIVRLPNKMDKRAKIIKIQPKGRSLFEGVRSAAIQLQAEVLSAIPPEQHESFLLNLERLADACDQAYCRTRQSSNVKSSKTVKREKQS
jgi:DNA-binding MarR family transcriptional regulator